MTMQQTTDDHTCDAFLQEVMRQLEEQRKAEQTHIEGRDLGITLRQLLNDCDFADIKAQWEKHEANSPVRSIEEYHEAYEIIRRFPVQETPSLPVVLYYTTEPWGEAYYDAFQLEQEPWAPYIDGEVYVPEDRAPCKAEVAYSILFSLVYWGVNPDPDMR